MTASSHAAIAHAFVTARRQAAGLPAYPGPVPGALDEAYAVQAIAMDLIDDAVGGWKVGRIPASLVESYGADRLAGPIFSSTIKPVGAESAGLIFTEGFGAAEAEFLLRVGRAPDPGKTAFTLEEAADHIDAVHIGIEIASSPFAGINDLGPAVTISDFGNNNGLLIGPTVADWRSLAFADEDVSLTIDGVVAGAGQAANFPDGPMGSVRFLLENLAARGVLLQVGSWISTGAVTGVHKVAIGQGVVADFGSLGTVECRILPQHPATRA